MIDEESKNEDSEQNECVVHTHPVPPGELDRYSVEADPHLEKDIASYVESQAPDESIQHVEKIRGQPCSKLGPFTFEYFPRFVPSGVIKFQELKRILNLIKGSSPQPGRVRINNGAVAVSVSVMVQSQI